MHCPYCGAPIEILTAACPFCGAATLLGERYEIRARIGRGGMGEVFRAYDRRLDTDVALKRLPPQFSADPALRASLTREAQLMARLSDASIVRLYDLEEYAGSLYLILEYVPGPSLSPLLKAGYRASLEETARLLGEICNGLRNAHRSGVIHRDLKPSNLLLSLTGAERAAFEASQTLPASLGNTGVKIADFGIAKAVRESRATFTGEFAGTPGYTAPEQLQGAPVTAAADVYALGVLTCELLTGTLPAGRSLIPGVPPAVSAVIVQACSFDPVHRYASAEAYYQAFAAAVEGRAAPLTRPKVTPARTGWLSVLAIGAIALAVIAIIGAISYTLDSRKPRAQTILPLPNFDDTPTMEFHAPPRADSLPPVIAVARGRVPSSGLLGPANPKILWTVKLPITVGMRIAAIGIDGTVYLTGLDHILAVREAELRWGYKLGIGGVSDLRLDEDGRVWFNSGESLYCFNRDGSGGRVAKDSPAPPRPGRDRARCVYGGQLHGGNWKYELDSPCTPAGAMSGPDGMAYAATDVPEILAVNPTGKLAWRSPTPCSPQSMQLLATGSIFYTCQDKTIHAIAGAKPLYHVTADGNLYNGFTSGADGTVYYGDYVRDSGGTHMHAIGADGRKLWSLDSNRVTLSHFVLGQQRRLYVSGSFLKGRLLCLGD